MPYIRDELRLNLETPIQDVQEQLRKVPQEKRKGCVNYAVSRIVAYALKPENGWSYSSLSDAISVLRDAANEMERRLMIPYENVACNHNGDIPEYQETNGEVE